MHQRKTLLGVIVVLAFVCLAESQLVAQAARASNAPTTPPVNFAPPVNYTVGTLPFANAVADFNGDHILDIAVVNYKSNNVSVLFGKGDGTFEPAVNYATGTEPSAITALDLNNDGVPDLAIADEIGQTICILINNADGTGTFKPAVLYPAGMAPRGIAVVPAGAEAESNALDVLQSLRAAGLRAEIEYRGNLKRRMERANRAGAHTAVILGEAELARGVAQVKNLHVLVID